MRAVVSPGIEEEAALGVLVLQHLVKQGLDALVAWAYPHVGQEVKEVRGVTRAIVAGYTGIHAPGGEAGDNAARPGVGDHGGVSHHNLGVARR